MKPLETTMIGNLEGKAVSLVVKTELLGPRSMGYQKSQTEVLREADGRRVAHRVSGDGPSVMQEDAVNYFRARGFEVVNPTYKPSGEPVKWDSIDDSLA